MPDSIESTKLVDDNAEASSSEASSSAASSSNAATTFSAKETSYSFETADGKIFDVSYNLLRFSKVFQSMYNPEMMEALGTNVVPPPLKLANFHKEESTEVDGSEASSSGASSSGASSSEASSSEAASSEASSSEASSSTAVACVDDNSKDRTIPITAKYFEHIIRFLAYRVEHENVHDRIIPDFKLDMLSPTEIDDLLIITKMLEC